MREEKFSATIVDCGCDAKGLVESGFVVLFGGDVPEIIRDCVFMHHAAAPTSEIVVGDVLEIDGTTYRITHIGEVANKNLAALGHVSFLFGAGDDVLPGAMRVDGAEAPHVDTGSVVRILAAA